MHQNNKNILRKEKMSLVEPKSLKHQVLIS